MAKIPGDVKIVLLRIPHDEGAPMRVGFYSQSERVSVARFEHKIGLHYNCNSLRGISLASPSEIKMGAIVTGLQDAYMHPVFRTARYAVFHTGPSATADIGGVLIHGAQGVRSLTVIVG